MRPTLRCLLFLLLLLPSPLAAAGHDRETDRLQRTPPGPEHRSVTAPALRAPVAPPPGGASLTGGRYTTLEGYYDYQSNTGPVRQIVVDSASGDIHVVYMLSEDSSAADASRRTGYAWTTDEGLTWTCNTARVPSVRSGYPSIDLLAGTPQSQPLVANHNAGGGTANLSWAYIGDNTCFFVEFAPVPSVYTPEPIWPMITGLASGGVMMHASANDPGNPDSYKNYIFRAPDLVNWDATVVPVADGSGGRYDLWADPYVQHVATAVNGDSCILWESSNDGVTWGPVQLVHPPLRIVPGTPAETLGVWSGPSGIFFHGSPVVALNTSIATDGGTSYLFAGARIEVWRPGHGFRTAVMWDSLVHPRLMVRQSNHLSLGYPSLGVSGNVIVMAYQAFLNDEATRDSAAGGRFFSDVFLVQSTDGGETWSLPVNVTNTPQLDERYPSMAKWNPAGYACLTWQEDTRAGSGINDDGVPVSLAKQVLYKADLTALFPMNDLAGSAVTSPAAAAVIRGGDPFTPAARFRNVGLAGQSGIPVSFQLVNGEGTVVHSVSSSIGALPPGEYTTVTFSEIPGSVTATLAPGVYTTRAVALLAGDTNPSNDTTASALGLIPRVEVTTTYAENFEPLAGGKGGGFGWLALREGSASPPDWVLGTPAKTQIAGPRSGTRCWVTRLTGSYSDDEESFLASPSFDLSGLTGPVILTFWHNFEMEPEWDGGVLQISTDGGGTWATVDQHMGTGLLHETPSSTFWYNEDVDSSGTVFGVPMFSLSSAAYSGAHAGWIRSSTILPVGGLADVRFRFRWSADEATSYEGWAVDDVGLRAAPASVTAQVAAGWNMVSRPVITALDSVRQIFPTATQEYAFAFDPGSTYQQRWRMDLGTGYWLKFPAAASPLIAGAPVLAAAIPVVTGWNLVGSVSGPVDTAVIGADPPDLRASLWYGFTGGYTPAAQLLPGRGYWIKAAEPGFFILMDGAGADRRTAAPPETAPSSVTVTDAAGFSGTAVFHGSGELRRIEEMPPPPPEGTFDVRLEENPAGRNTGELLLRIRGGVPPLTVQWNLSAPEDWVLVDAVRERILTPEGMGPTGTLTLADRTAALALRAGAEPALPREAALGQNYPNPFNPVTTITFAVPGSAGTSRQGGTVSLQVFDVLGRRVATLVDDTRAPGVYSVTFPGGDASDLASGVYLYRLTIGGFTATRRMMLIK